ncbi:helix-turn-helix transcriptional regulator [Enterobacter ludwigii]|uniref:helix-turn-helix transcriptional regulator n=1 Tax=Enterobacter ludwigii TaxID=299767 RepID=UPI00273D2BAA|nr:LuxR C-terminal-related transcriptional regulator [Enterobacter ludwigii]MDP5163575.1 LuxR C-terminal-related transcriptional regulator [Enterobacter ludwigii]
MIKTIKVLVVSENNYFINGLSLILKETFINVSFSILHVKPEIFYMRLSGSNSMKYDIIFMDAIIMWSFELLAEAEKSTLSSKITLPQLKEYIGKIVKNRDTERDITLPRFKLSKRELEFWALLFEGECDRRICNKMRISIKTVSTHKRNIINKLGLQNKNHLINLMSKMKISQ